MEEFEILTNVLLSNCKDKRELEGCYILLREELEKLTKNREKELERVI